MSTWISIYLDYTGQRHRVVPFRLGKWKDRDVPRISNITLIEGLRGGRNTGKNSSKVKQDRWVVDHCPSVPISPVEIIYETTTFLDSHVHRERDITYL